ncbi:nonribosomal siderophore peptide synthase SidC [Trichophyton verrucosum HKI 0517]|uniref:Nonribosomal peptide synthetase sidC n=1 Tax=Trichophyton verrucosum (strain HKI 0517) TaxID=663202 RepID=D4DE85_TRIVH|nr:nonribosomal siderophore peptide synthase SidC [Trichophyton verrucosum HKI 0517]EFE39833.1 nonribosomal siderophore peptide synthase SidC [Trichophyton verrucosum HKI 0517]
MDSFLCDRYTQFPSLNYGTEAVPSQASATWKLDNIIDLDRLILAWASILSRLSEEESPVIQIDGAAARIHLEGGHIESVQIEKSGNSGSHTAIVTSDTPITSERCQLEIRYTPHQLNGSITSRGCTSVRYLDQLARNLESLLREPLPLSIVNPTPLILPGPHLFHEMVRHTGNEPAISFLNESGEVEDLSYEMLHYLSEQLASHLVHILASLPPPGQHGKIIPVLLPQSLDLYVAWLAILKAGAAVCPLNLDTPTERLNFIVGDVDARVVVTNEGLTSAFQNIETSITIVKMEESKTFAPGCLSGVDVCNEDLAYVMYTSGSTGLPKGVGISHQAAVQALLAHDEIIPGFRRFLQFAAPTFDVSVFEIFFPLFRGVTLVGCNRRLMLNDLPGIINQLNVDAAELTPTVCGELLQSRDAVPCLKLLLTIGEMLTRHVVDEFGSSEDKPGLLHGMYGPTEATIHCTAVSSVRAGSLVGNIGTPFKTVSAFIISMDHIVGQEPVILPVGHVGELVIGGPQLARYYLNRPTENRNAFIDSKTYGRLYRTGDKARLHPNGELQCMGRISTGQVKLRGQRIELGEIENVLLKNQYVRNAAACVIQGALVAFLSADVAHCTSRDLQLTCRRSLPKFMIPGNFVILNKLPRLPSGKIDRKGLEAEYILSKGVDQTDLAEPAGDIEQKISVSLNLLLESPITPTASLASAGLDSLRAIHLASSLRKEGVFLNALDILEADSIRKMAALVLKTQPEMTMIPTESEPLKMWNTIIQQGHEMLKLTENLQQPTDIIPCSPIQTGMLLETKLNPKTYFNSVELQFDRGISLEGVKSAFISTALQNEVLRSGFIEIDFPGFPYAQVVWESLHPDQIIESKIFDHNLELQNQWDILHPLRVQLCVIDGQPKALVHIHHSLYDGWSWDQIMWDLASALENKQITQRPQYRLFTLFHINNHSSEIREQALNYWQSHLQGSTPCLWPNFQDRSDLPKVTQVIERQFNIDIDQLDSFVRDFRIGRQIIFQAAIGYLLSAYNGTSDIILGNVSAGRTLPIDGIESIVGPCISTLPLRLNLQKARTVRDLLAILHGLNRKSLVHGFVPLRDVKQVSGINTADQLFDTLFVWQDSFTTICGPIAQVASRDFLEFTLTTELGIQDGKIRAKATFEESILPESHVVIFLKQIESIAMTFLESADRLLEDIPSHLPKSLLSMENTLPPPLKYVPGLSESVEELAKIDSERIAVEFLDSLDPETGDKAIKTLTYSELDAQSNKLASQLRNLGVVEGNLVAICLEKSLELYISILAVIKSGAGYVPMTPQTPINRVKHIIQEASCRICIADSEILVQLSDLPNTRTILAKNQMLMQNALYEFPKAPGSSPAYAVFTSGTTGTPKGVLISRFNLESNIAVLSALYPDFPESRLLQACSHAFDVSVFEIFFAWSRGMTLCSAKNDVLFRDIEHAIRILRITHLSMTPTVAALVRANNVPLVKFLVTAGEALTPKVLMDWAGKGLWQGRPLPNTSAFVLAEGERFSLVPRGAIGELCFGGDQVGIGYLNMEDLTRQKFLVHEKYGRIYKSGDYGRLLPDGSIAFVGRRDDLVKIRGQRIELGEITSILMTHESVKDCATILCDSNNGDCGDSKQLISFWVPENINIDGLGQHENSHIFQQLFDYIGDHLPSYMIPSFLIPISHIPMTTVGRKIDKEALKYMYLSANPTLLDVYSRGEKEEHTQENLTDNEAKVAELVAQVTGVSTKEIGRHTSFYRLGFDSVIAIAFSRELKLAGFGQIDISVIMKNDSITRLTRKMSQNTEAQMPGLESIPAFNHLFSPGLISKIKDEASAHGVNVTKILPCTSLQEGMLSGISTGNDASYYNHLVFEINMNIELLKMAWMKMVARHDILRTWFQQTDDARFPFVQVVLERLDIAWRSIECPIADAPSTLERSKLSVAVKEGPHSLYSFTVLQCVDSPKVFLLLSIHHALYDGEAMEVLLQEVQDCVLEHQLPPVVPFDLYLHEMIDVNSDSTDQFWSNYLKDFTPTLFTSPSSLVKGSPKMNRSTSHIPSSSFTEVCNACKSSSVTTLSLLQAAWSRLICLLSGSPDICFGDVVNCRGIPIDGAERIVGPCFNTLPVRTSLNGNMTNIDLMRNLQFNRASTLPYQLSSMRRIQSRFSQRGQRIFDSLLLLQGRPLQLNESLWRMVSENGVMDFPIIFEVVPNPESDSMQFIFHFDEGLVPTTDIDIIIASYHAILTHTLRFPEARAMDFSLVESEGQVPGGLSVFRKIGEGNRDHKTNGYDESEEWGEGCLEIRDLLSAMSKIDKKRINMDTTIFELGLDSINAIQIAGHFRKVGYEISAADILEGPSIRDIALVLQGSKANDCVGLTLDSFDFNSFQSLHLSSICDKLGLLESNIEAIRPCTPPQAGMLASFINSEGLLYFNSLTLKSPAPLNLIALRFVWESVMERNEMLRTGFCDVKDDIFPFAMVTYRPGVIELPWNECLSPSKSISDARREQHLNGKSILNQLHHPPWFLTVKPCSGSTLMQLSAHHALYDAHSMNLILSEVINVYNGSTLPPAIPVSSVLGYIVEKFQSPESESYWSEVGPSFSATKFPDMNPLHAKVNDTRFLSRDCSFTMEKLQEGCRELGVTLQAVGQAAWSRILSSYLGESTVTYGLVLSGRDISEQAQDTAFPCITTVPAQQNVEATNRELLQQIMKSNAMAVKYQFTSLAKIQRLSKADSPLFDTLFVFQKLASTDKQNTLWDVVEENSQTEYSVSLELIPSNDTLKLAVTYQNHILPDGQASLLLDELDWLLTDILQYPDSTSSSLDTASRSIVSVLPRKDTKIDCPTQLLHQFVEVGATRHPSKVALEFAERVNGKLTTQSWTYKDLDEQGNRYANLLHHLGVKQGTLVGVSFQKCPEAYFSILGVLKVGCAFLAIDPSAPIARKQFILEDSKADVLMCGMGQQNELKNLTGIRLVVVNEEGLLNGVDSTPPTLSFPIHGDETCYCLYTSGSTGTPKGCEITHDNAVQAMLSFQRLFGGHWDESSRWFQFASFHFDVSVLEQYWTWSVGICLTSCPRDTLFEDFAGTLRDLSITHIDLTPSLAQLIHPEDVPSLCRGVFITGGEKLKQEILEHWGPHEVIYNGYGPTEVTIGCTMLPRVTSSDKPTNIGPQFDNVSGYVFKQGTNTPVLRGGIGELCVSGPLVGKGYLNRPQLTAEKFQYIETYGERVYRTGDLVRMMHDGSFCFLGRIDDQVKLRGQRLEINEINHVIKNSTEGVGDVVTMVLKHPTATKEQIVSFTTVLTSASTASCPEVDFSPEAGRVLEAIRLECRSHLPGYMIPTHIIPLTKFPLSSNNKIDNGQLRGIFASMVLSEMQTLSSHEQESPTEDTDTIRAIIPILSRFTKVEEKTISSSSNIFELGLDSILVISFSRALREAGFPAAHPSVVMKCSTISLLAKAIESPDNNGEGERRQYEDARQKIAAFAHMHMSHVANELEVAPQDIEAITPCTSLQDGMLYQCLRNESHPYLTSFKFQLAPHTDIPMLKEAWKRAQVSFQLLRTNFPLTDDGYALVVLKEAALPWFEFVISKDDELESTAESHFKKWNLGFNNFMSRVWEIGIVSSPKRRWMCLNIFHGLYDGVSLPIILDAVKNEYNSGQIPRSMPFTEVLPLGPLRTVPAAKSFWVKHLEDLSQTTIPRIPLPEPGSRTLTIRIEGFHGIEETRRSLGVTEQAMFHACWVYTFERYFSYTPTMGIVVSGRSFDSEDANTAVGPLFNTIPCNIPKSGFSTFSGLVKACHDYSVSALPFQHTPLRSIMKWIGRSSQRPLFDVLFVFQKQENTTSQSGESLWEPVASFAEADYPLALEVQSQGSGSFQVTAACQGDILTSDGISDLLENFKLSLRIFVEEPFSNLGFSGDSTSLEASSKQLANKVIGDPSPNGTASFQWSQAASLLRQEIAKLANLDVSEINEDSSILEVGLDSIDAIKLSSRLKRDHIDLSVGNIMRNRTIRTMMAEVTVNGSATKADLTYLKSLESQLRRSLEEDGKDLGDIEHIYPATPLQEGMINEMLSSDGLHYFNHDILQINEDVDVTMLKNAWETIAKRHPILRTSFATVPDPNLPFSYAQLIHKSSIKIDWNIVDVAENSIESIIQEERARALSLVMSKPLFNLRLIRDRAKLLLILSLPHAMYDGWSLTLLHQDVASAYSGQFSARPSYQHVLEAIISSSRDEGLQFWKGVLSDAEPSIFPPQPGAGGQGALVHRDETASDIPLSHVLDFCKAHGVTAQALGLTCWTIVLASYLGQLDVLFGTVMLGRDTEEASKIAFPTMNTVAVRGILHGSVSEMLEYVQRNLGNMLAHQHYPLRKIKSMMGVGNKDLFDTLFIYQKSPSSQESQDKPLYKSINSSSSVEYSICVELEAIDDSAVWRVACKDTILSKKDTSQLVLQLLQVFKAIIQSPEMSTADFVEVRERPTLDSVTQNGGSLPDGPSGIAIEPVVWSLLEDRIRDTLSLVAAVPKEEITRNTTIFHFGIDSISAIKVSSLLRRQSVLISVRDILRAETVGKMAEIVNSAQEKKPTTATSREKLLSPQTLRNSNIDLQLGKYGMKREDVEAFLPATAGQIYMLETWKNSHGKLFFPDFFYRVTGRITQSQLDSAWKVMTAKLPILRTTILSIGDTDMPYVLAELKQASNPIIWRSDLRVKSNRRHVAARQGSGLVYLYASQTETETLLMLHIHHALYDAVVLQHLINILESLCQGVSTPVSTPVDIAEFIQYGKAMSSEAQQEAFWRGYLGSDTTPVAQNASGPVMDVQAGAGKYQPGLLDNTDWLNKICQAEGLSVQAVFLAAYSKVHVREFHVRGADLTVGVYLANRSHDLVGLPELVAPTLNIVPLRIQDPGSRSVFELARIIQSDLHEIGSAENCTVSLAQIAEWTGIRLDTTVNFIKLPEVVAQVSTATTGAPQLVQVTEEEVLKWQSKESCNSNGSEQVDVAAKGSSSKLWLEEMLGIESGVGLENAGDVYKVSPPGSQLSQDSPEKQEANNKPSPQPSVDIEAAVRNNTLDVGVFGPSSDKALGVLDGVRRELLALQTSSAR